jgi:hypothetical protein
MTLIFSVRSPFLLIYLAGVPVVWAICILLSEYPNLTSSQEALAKAIVWPIGLVVQLIELPFRLWTWVNR